MHMNSKRRETFASAAIKRKTHGGFSPFWTFAVVSKKKKPQGNPTAIGEIPVFLWHPWRHPRPDMRLDHLPGRRRHPHRDLDHLAEAPTPPHRGQRDRKAWPGDLLRTLRRFHGKAPKPKWKTWIQLQRPSESCHARRECTPFGRAKNSRDPVP